jgi:S-adenosylmethionine:tRNA ribosyltransferase-isomerase
MRVDDFDFEHARLLHVRGRALGDFTMRDLPGVLREGDLLVLNDTRVIPAQLAGMRAGRGAGAAVKIDATLHKLLIGDPAVGARWRAFIRPAKRLKPATGLISGRVSAPPLNRATAQRRFCSSVSRAPPPSG